ncbi:MAG: hypothetical protein WC634_01340 [archaeon]
MPLKLTVPNSFFHLIIAFIIIALLTGAFAYVVLPGAVPNPGHALSTIQGYFQGDASLVQSLAKIQQEVMGQCAVGSSIRVINADGTVSCEADDVGVTSISAGTGITLAPNPITTTGTISANTSVLQNRVSGTCAVGNSIRVINANGTVTCEAAGGGGVPSGVIVMWSGTLASVPAGWHLCDGTAGTPDLRDKFIYGWTAGVNPGGTGGTASHTHAPGTYSVTVPAHTHGVGTYGEAATGHRHGISFDWAVIQIPEGENYDSISYDIVPNFTDTTAVSISGSSASGGGASVAVSGTSASTTTLPPYYKLAFIMKI